MLDNWWKTEGLKKYPQAKILDEFVSSRGYIPLSSEADTSKVMRRVHQETGLPLDVAPLTNGANFWTFSFKVPPFDLLSRTDYNSKESRNSNLQNALKHNKDEYSRPVIAWKMNEVNSETLQDLDALLQIYETQQQIGKTEIKDSSNDNLTQLHSNKSFAKKKDYSELMIERLEQSLKVAATAGLVTEEIREAKQRRFQNTLRTLLLEKRKNCEVTGVKTEEVLIASHIKPWKHCEDKEKIDMENLLLLSAHFDNLFDKGLISFNDQGKILISSSLDKTERKRLNLSGNESLQTDPSLKQCVYLKFHRKMHGFE